MDASGLNYRSSVDERISDRMDRNFRVYSEGVTTNAKVYKESTIHAQVNHNLSNLRPKQRHFYERVPQERIDEYHQVRKADIDRSQKMVNNRFPELSAAREAFLGQESRLPAKNIQAQEVVKFSEVVEQLAREEEPFPARAQLMSTQFEDQVGEETRNQIGERSKSMNNPSAFNLGKLTLSASIKSKYIVRSRHKELTTNRFIPVCQSQARSSVKTEIIHDAGEPKRINFEDQKRSTIKMKSIHGQSVFRKTSPVTQDPFKASPSVTLDSDNNFSKFCPPDRGQKNARQTVLDNFKEISRIMTQSFLTHKKLEKIYSKTAIPQSELAKMREEELAQCRMTSILKQMHSPSNFAAPQSLLPGEKAVTRSSIMQPKESVFNTSPKKLSSSSPLTANSKKFASKFVSSNRRQEEDLQ